MSAPEWTIEQWVEHGREWVRAGWTWAPGQVALATGRRVALYRIIITDVEENHPTHGTGESLHGAIGGLEVVPDLRDSGTRGHALDQVRLALDDDSISVTRCDGCAWVHRDIPYSSLSSANGRDGGIVAAESAALLAARRAAP